MNRKCKITMAAGLVLLALLTSSRGFAAIAVPTVSTTGTLATNSCWGHGVSFTCKIATGSGAVRLIGFTVTGDPGTGFGSGQITVSGLQSGVNLLHQFILTSQASSNPASINQLNVAFPVPIQSAAAGSITITIPALGNSSSIVTVAMEAVIY